MCPHVAPTTGKQGESRPAHGHILLEQFTKTACRVRLVRGWLPIKPSYPHPASPHTVDGAIATATDTEQNPQAGKCQDAA